MLRPTEKIGAEIGSSCVGSYASFYVRAMRMVICILAVTAFSQPHGYAAARGKAEHVIVMVWDGMRPDFIGAQHTPTLYGLAQEGSYFQHHHAVFVPTTEVNAVALNTGVFPERSGISANRLYRPEIDRQNPVAMEALDTVRLGDLATQGHYLPLLTVAEIVQHSGFETAICGTKAVALLLDRSEERSSTAAKESVDFFKGHVLPPSAMARLVEANDGQPFPEKITFPNVAQDQWTTRALSRGLWKDKVPKFSVLWLSDPDYSQHETGPGSAPALSALESVDRNLAELLKSLDEKKVREKTDLFVVSDHGFSSLERMVNVTQLLTQAGFRAAKHFASPRPGDVLVVDPGGSVFLYVAGHDETIVRKLAQFFQSSDFAGVIFSRKTLAGAFPLKKVRIGTKDAPDLLVSFHWSLDVNPSSTPGLLVGDSTKKGTHGSLSPYDLHNTLVAAGPDFRSGFRDELPTGNLDLAPTILWILGIKPPHSMDGRVLSEALISFAAPKAKPEKRTLEASCEGEHFRWRQYLKVSTIGKEDYFEEGNGKSVQK